MCDLTKSHQFPIISLNVLLLKSWVYIDYSEYTFKTIIQVRCKHSSCKLSIFWLGVKFKYELFTRWSKSVPDWTRIMANNMPVDFIDNFSSPQRRNGGWSSLQEAQNTHIWKLVLPIYMIVQHKMLRLMRIYMYIHVRTM